ncbi:restriction endonuclease subunit S [Paenibacillus sp. YPG26]|uniref:restriction endonuclease subunit S n=1 Tax=Paenibacillus sp. YPG26 TaxID=2878915 RepID=UPI00203EAC7F|nr:restriction endonuclease subunit S [Paenibacillus sp. YPG26]USB33930.1 restriction endonuclease subunit S [Paenibacillus sp. YPG26]
MSKWEMVTLNTVCSLITDGTHQTPQYAEKGYMFLSSKNVTTGKINWEDIKYIPEDLHNQLYTRIAPQIGDVLLAKNGTTGIAAVVDKDYVFDIYVSLALLRPKDFILSEFLLHAINNPFTKRKFNRELKGIGVPNLHLRNIRETTIPLPPIETQKHIAKTLDTAAELLAMRKQQLAELDNLIKSTFYDMFGDPVVNTQGWEKILLGDLIKEIKYGTSTPPVFTDSGYCFIRATNIKRGRITENDMKYISEGEATKISKCKLKLGDLIIVRSGVNTGDTCVITEKYLGQYAGYDLIITPNQELLDSYYLNELINTTYMERVVKPLTRRAAQPHLNAEQTKNLPIIVPPIELQTQFATIVTQIEEQKALVKKAIDETQHLFDSLMSEYFE